MSKRRIALGTRKGLLVIAGEAKQWEVESEAHRGARIPFAMADVHTGRIYATIDHGHFGAKLAFLEPGKEWEEIDAPAYPSGEKLGNGKDAVLKYLWCLQPCPHQAGRIYLGTEPGGLFVSNDHGATFELVEPLWNHPSRLESWQGGGLDNPAIHSIIVDPRDANHLQVGISVAGVFQSQDGGNSWKPTNRGLTADFLPSSDVEVGHDPHFVAQCNGTPDVVWQQNHCGVFRSTDGGVNWTDVSSDDGWVRFGFTIAVDPEDPETAWVIPAESDMVRVAIDKKLGVARTTDGGNSWQRLDKGLPQDMCYDFALRHAMDFVDDELAFGTSGGSVYYSPDRGEHWECIGTDFPQVYSVRFLPD